jgi:hypothetical protein
MHRHRQFVVLWLVLLMGGITTAHAQQPPTLPEWSPSQALLKKLGGLFSVEGYLLQPPANYKLVIPDTGVPEGVSSYVWLGEERKDKTHPLLMVTLLVPPPEEARKLSPAEVATTLLAGIKDQRRDWTQTPMATGTVQGLKFVRIGWTGIDKKEKRKMQGWMMVAHDGDTFIALSSQDIVPYAEQSLPLAEAAARTFKLPDPRIFYSTRWTDHAQIYAMNPDGSKPVCLTPLSDTDYGAVLSPDGTTIAFTTHRDGVRALYLMNPDGTNQRRITQKEDAGLCAWSPDGSQLAFSSNRSGRYCIYVMQHDGSNVRKLTDGPSDDFPAWSPDGSQIAYEGNPDQNWRIYLANVDGSGTKAITKGKWSDRWPQWAAGGDQIAYTSYEQGKGQIYMMHPDGTAVKRLTNNAAEDRQPFWTADSRQILFHSNRAGKFDIYTFDLATHEERRLTTDPKDTAEVTTLGRSHSLTP